MFRALKLEAEIAAVGNLSRRSLLVCNRFMTVYSTMDYIGGGAEQGKGRKSPISKTLHQLTVIKLLMFLLVIGAYFQMTIGADSHFAKEACLLMSAYSWCKGGTQIFKVINGGHTNSGHTTKGHNCLLLFPRTPVILLFILQP